MKRIGEDIAEKLDYTPGIFTVERHVRGHDAHQGHFRHVAPLGDEARPHEHVQVPGCERVEQDDWLWPRRGDWMSRLEEVLLEQAGYVEIIGRAGTQHAFGPAGLDAYYLRVSNTGAWSLRRSLALASDAATLTARQALQCHGAMGYSFEYDLHLFMKRAWALAATWGDAAGHRARVGRAIL